MPCLTKFSIIAGKQICICRKIRESQLLQQQLIEVSETSVKYDALTAAKIVEDLQSDDNNMPIQILHKCGQTTK